MSDQRWIDRIGWAVTRRLYRWGERWALRHGKLAEFRQAVGWLPEDEHRRQVWQR